MLSQFAIRLVAGLSLTWCVMPRGQITSGFFRIQMLVTLGLAVLAGISAGQSGEEAGSVSLPVPAVWLLTTVLAVVSFVGSVLWTLERRTGGTRCGFLIAAVAVAGTLGGAVSFEQLRTLAGNLTWLTELTTACVSGAAVGGMLLGHWYLTAPAMSTLPLNRVNGWLGAAAGLRLLCGAAALLLVRPWSGDGLAGSRWTGTFSVWLALEWIGGILGPLAACVMVQRILRYRNTQSATGVLFVAVILAFLGEMTGALLRRELALPV